MDVFFSLWGFCTGAKGAERPKTRASRPRADPPPWYGGPSAAHPQGNPHLLPNVRAPRRGAYNVTPGVGKPGGPSHQW